MKILLFIDTLNSGGAQRQIVNLSILLKNRGYDVLLLRYYHHNHFKTVLDSHQIESVLITSTYKFMRIYKLYKFLIFFKPNVLISFLDIPSLISSLASLFINHHKLIVSERVMEIGKPSKVRRLLRNLYFSVDHITTNSFGNKELILSNKPKVHNKLSVIYNSVDFTKFYPNSNGLTKDIRFIVVASFRKTKNPQGLVKAIKIIIESNVNINFKLDWYGHKNPNKIEDNSSSVYDEAISLIKKYNLQNIIKFKDPVEKIENEYRNSTALILPSFTEGVPNVVCESMACGLPILLSNVADADILIENKKNGFLFNPYNTEDIAREILNFINLPFEKKVKMGQANVVKARKLFAPERYCEDYIKLFK